MRETDNDPSASTASFRAFAQRADDVPARRASSSRAITIAAIVCAVLVLAVLIVFL
jgi:hypothetical protein